MKRLRSVVGILVAVAATGASAQSINLTGIYTCVEMCRGALPAHVTQNGSALNLITEAWVPARAWPDWFSPASRIWMLSMKVQFIPQMACSFSSTMGQSGSEACHRLQGGGRDQRSYRASARPSGQQR
jgi:hypothetical protein